MQAPLTHPCFRPWALSSLPAPALPYNYQQLSYLTSHVFLDTNRPSLFVGFGTILLLYACRTPRKFYPKNKPVKYIYTASTLVVVLVATVVARWLVLAGVDLPILGKVHTPIFDLNTSLCSMASHRHDPVVDADLSARCLRSTSSSAYLSLKPEPADPPYYRPLSGARGPAELRAAPQRVQ